MDPEDPYSDPDHFQNSIISWPFTFSDISWKFHQNPSISFWFILYTNTSGSLDPDDPDHSQNLITCSLYHLGHLLKMSSQSIHNFLRYLSLKIKFHGSRRSRQWSGSLAKFNHIFLLPFWTYPENFIKIHLSVFELSCSQTNKQTNKYRAKNDPRSGTLAVSGWP